MARLLTEGFEMQDLVGYSSPISNMSFIDTVLSTSEKHSGTSSVALGYYSTFGIPFASSSEIYFRMWVYFTSSFRMRMYWRNYATTLGYIEFDWDGRIRVYAGDPIAYAKIGTNILSFGNWYLLEMYIKIADSGTITVKIDGVEDSTWSGDTKPGTDTTINNVAFFTGGWLGIPFPPLTYIDDVAINDTTGGVDDSWCGDGRIIGTLPAGTAFQQLNGSDGNATDNHLLVNEIPTDSDTTYVKGIVADEEDLYTLTACGLTGVTINRVWTEARAKDSAGAGGKVALITKAAGGSEVSGGDVYILNSYTKKILGAEQLLNPVDSEAWTPEDIDDVQIGPRTRI